MTPPSPLSATMLVAAGGATGSVLRYHAGRMISAVSGLGATFPWPTFAINVVGSLAMGLLAGLLARHGSGGETWRLLIAVGLLGGFTTFSSFSLETAMLLERGLIGTAAIYATGSVLAGVAGLFLGLAVVRVAV